MRYTIPEYYKRFHCTASDCPDSCCAGWEITIDSKSRSLYHNMPGGLGNRIRNSLHKNGSVFCQYKGRCCFLNEHNLCDIYIEAGPGFLCKTCREFPRHVEEFPGIREVSLSLSCIEAANIILGWSSPVGLLTKVKQTGQETFRQFDSVLFSKLIQTRSVLFQILQDREQSIKVRIAMTLALGHDLQSRIDKEAYWSVDRLLERYQRADAVDYCMAKFSGYTDIPKQGYRVRKMMMKTLFGPEYLKKVYADEIRLVQLRLYSNGSDTYNEDRIRFHAAMGKDQEQGTSWEIWCEQLMVYFIYTYFYGAVYDSDGNTKIKLAAASTLMIQEIAFFRWMENGRKLDFADFVTLAHRYSREVEHSHDMLNEIEELLSDDTMFGLKDMLIAVLS